MRVCPNEGILRSCWQTLGPYYSDITETCVLIAKMRDYLQCALFKEDGKPGYSTKGMTVAVALV